MPVRAVLRVLCASPRRMGGGSARHAAPYRQRRAPAPQRPRGHWLGLSSRRPHRSRWASTCRHRCSCTLGKPHAETLRSVSGTELGAWRCHSIFVALNPASATACSISLSWTFVGSANVMTAVPFSALTTTAFTSGSLARRFWSVGAHMASHDIPLTDTKASRVAGAFD